MPKYTAKPDKVSIDYLSRYGGAASDIAAITDGSDTTYVKANSTNTSYLAYSKETLGSGERIVSIAPYARHSCPGTKNVTVAVRGYPYFGMGASLVVPPGSTANHELPAYLGTQLNPNYGEWNVTGGGYGSSISDPHTSDANRALFYEVGLYVYATKAATIATPSAPSGTVTTTQYPTCTATVSSIVESWQVPSGQPPFMCGVQVEFGIYKEADIGTATEPGSATPVWYDIVDDEISNYIDGTTASTKAVSAVPDIPLANGNYVLFVRTSRTHPSGNPAWSSYQHVHWVQNIVLPTAPTLTPAADTSGQRISLTVNVPTTSGYDSSTAAYEIQRQTSDGWREVRGLAGPIATGSNILVGYDYECDRETGNTYRARCSMWHTADGVTRYSAWATASPVTGPSFAGTGWNLKTVEDQSLSWVGAPVAGEPAEAVQRTSAILEPLDRGRPVVVSGSIGGLSGSLEVVATGTTEVAALEAIEDYAGLVYLETAFGDARWVKLTKTGWSRQGTRANPRRRVLFEWVEVGHGLEVVAS